MLERNPWPDLHSAKLVSTTATTAIAKFAKRLATFSNLQELSASSRQLVEFVARFALHFAMHCLLLVS